MTNPSGTGVVNINSDLVRRKWMMEGLVQDAYKSFWSPYMGNSHKSIVYSAKNMNAKDGHTVVFDYDGNIVNAPVKGKETAYGKGEQKRKFSDKVTVERYRFVVDNGDEFDGVNIGDLAITQHQDSRMKLTDLYYRAKDQAITDVCQQNITHTIQLTNFTFDDTLDIEQIIKTGEGYKVPNTNGTDAQRRLPLKPFMMSNGQPIWLVAVDSPAKNRLLKSTGAQNFFKDADMRGNKNRVISGMIGKVGNLMFVEMDTFFGVTNGNIVDGEYAAMNNTSLQWAGLRQYKGDNFIPDVWSGQSGFDTNTEQLTSRCLILGAGAIQQAFGRMPDYLWQRSQDFGIKSESALELWCNTRITRLTSENEDYDTEVGGISYGVIGLDIQI